MRHEAIHVFESDTLTTRSLEEMDGTELRAASFVGCGELDDAAVKVIASWPLLETLDLSGCSMITNAGIAELAKCRNLEYLNAGWLYRVDDDGLEALEDEMKSLRRIVLTGCNVATRGVEALSNLGALGSVALPLSRHLNDDAIAWLAASKAPLRAVAFGGSGITPRAIRSLAPLETLQRIMLGNYAPEYHWYEFENALPPEVDLYFA